MRSVIRYTKCSAVKKDDKTKCEETEYCLMCKHDKCGNCHDSSIVYIITCLTCLKNKKKSIYVGETSKSGQERGSEHLAQSLSLSEKVLKKSVLIRHNVSDHDGNRAEYKMEKVRAFPRHVTEMSSSRIQQNEQRVASSVAHPKLTQKHCSHCSRNTGKWTNLGC